MLALTGVPGTGKTTIAQQIEDVTVVDANELARRVDAIEERDEDRDADVVDEARLSERARDALPEGPVVVEGLLAHHCDPDAVVLLRCHPEVLRRRLSERPWSEAKIEENVLAETLDALVPEIETEAGEVDTTDADPAELAVRVRRLLEEGSLDASWLDPIGTADWTDTLAAGDPR